MKVRYAAAGVALALAGMGLTGCGDSPKTSSSDKPEKIDVQQSAAWIKDAEAVKYTLGLSGDVATLKKLAAANGEKLTKDELEVLELLTSAKIVVVGSAKAATDPTSLGSVAIQLGGQDLLSAVVSQKDDLYLKVDPAQLPASLTAQLKKTGMSDPAQLAGMVDMFAPGAGDVLRNKWVHLDLGEIYELSGQPKPKTSADAATQAKAQKILEDLLAKVTITEDSADAAHKVATVKGADVKAAVKDLYALGAGMAGTGMPTADVEKELAKAEFPAESKVDLYFEGDKLVKVGVNIMQFDKKKTTGDEPLNVEIEFAEAKPVTAPAGAKKVDLSKAVENFKGMMGGGSLDG